jgi:hypothetical protein
LCCCLVMAHSSGDCQGVFSREGPGATFSLGGSYVPVGVPFVAWQLDKVICLQIPANMHKYNYGVRTGSGVDELPGCVPDG